MYLTGLVNGLVFQWQTTFSRPYNHTDFLMYIRTRLVCQTPMLPQLRICHKIKQSNKYDCGIFTILY